MFYNTTRKLVYGLITAGILLILYWFGQFLSPHGFNAPDNMIALKVYVIPLLGTIVSSIGFILLRLISELEDESLSIREELIQLRKLAENNLKDKHYNG
ncbi:hypothetical protein A8990_101396 [Paenibacillus taihuensis]|uniref:Uncharacterized protein n=1 Tax=Paenibacillus taihuensis TaxID=1156355 RepID=A0A3D9SJR0_9BACL|nr:hypothetical protein [Paenibacillus taihuensis]REE94600.1 hypothetical protein A8990_101396 [Paenibacillus taihuensis]